MTEEAKQVMEVCSTLKKICTTIDELSLFFLMGERNWSRDVFTNNTDTLVELEIQIHFNATGAKRILEQIIQIEDDENTEQLQKAAKFIRRLSRLEAKTKMISLN